MTYVVASSRLHIEEKDLRDALEAELRALCPGDAARASLVDQITERLIAAGHVIRTYAREPELLTDAPDVPVDGRSMRRRANDDVPRAEALALLWFEQGYRFTMSGMSDCPCEGCQARWLTNELHAAANEARYRR